MATHSFNVGDAVNVLNQTLGGRHIAEGLVTIRGIVESLDETYMVDFRCGAGTYERYVDPHTAKMSKAELDRHIADLNSK